MPARPGSLPKASLPEPLGPVGGREAVEAAVEHRARTGVWRLPHFATHGDARLFKKLSAVRVLLCELSPAERLAALGPGAGSAGLSQAALDSQVTMLIEHKAGPQGEAAAKATRALRLLRAHLLLLHAEESGQVARVVVAAVVRAELRRAQLAALSRAPAPTLIVS